MIGPMFFFPWFLLVLKEIFVTCFFGTVVSFIYFGVGPSLFGWPFSPFSKDIRICNVPCLRPWVRGWIPSPKGGRMQQMSWKVRVLAERCGQKWVNFGHQKDVLWIYPRHPETLGKSILSSIEWQLIHLFLDFVEFKA